MTVNKFLVTLKLEMAIILTDQAHKKFDDLDMDKIMRELEDSDPAARKWLQAKSDESIESATLVGWLEAREYHENMKPKQLQLL